MNSTSRRRTLGKKTTFETRVSSATRPRPKAVAQSVATMQMLAAVRVKAHRKRAAKATQWVRDREQARPMLQLMLRAWAGVARTKAARAARPPG